jgi:hypothetical protein
LPDTIHPSFSVRKIVVFAEDITPEALREVLAAVSAEAAASIPEEDVQESGGQQKRAFSSKVVDLLRNSRFAVGKLFF